MTVSNNIAPEGEPIVAAEEEAASLRVRLIPLFDRYGILIVIAFIGLVLYISQPDVFLSWRNIANIFKQIAMNAMLSIGMFLTILTAGIDLSVGSVMMLAMMSSGVLQKAGFAWPFVILVGPLVGLVFGCFNGLGITKLRMPHPFIMTLGMLFMARGIGNLISGGVPLTGFPDAVRFLGSYQIILGEIGGARINVPASLIATVVVYVAFWAFLDHTVLGRRIYAVGGNPQAARVSGISVDRVLIIVYSLCGFMAGIAGLVLIGRTGSAFPTAGTGAELEAIAAVIIGGASFFGGRGTVLGVFGGVLVMGLIKNGLNLNNVSVFWQQILIGAIIVIAVFLDVVRREMGTRR